MTTEAFYLFITIYLTAITLLGLGVGVALVIYAFRINSERDKNYREAKKRADGHFKQIRARMGNTRVRPEFPVVYDEES